MHLYDPTSSGPERVLHRAPALASVEGKMIGILENGKLNAPQMLGELAAMFQQLHGCTVMPMYSKTNASAPAPAEILAQAAREVDFLITGLGD